MFPEMLHPVWVTVSLEPTFPATVDVLQVTPAPPRTKKFAAPPRDGAGAANTAREVAASSANVPSTPRANLVMRFMLSPFVVLARLSGDVLAGSLGVPP